MRLGAMGDILHALPAVTALRAAHPDAWIGWAIEPQWIALLRAASEKSNVRGPAMPVVDAIHIVPAKQWVRRPLAPSTFRAIRSVRRKLQEQRYDLCIDLQGAVRSAWIGRSSGVPRMVGEAHPREPLARWFFGEKVVTHGTHVIEQAREVVAVALQETLPCVRPALPVDEAAERWCQTWLRDRNVERFVLLNPGAGWGAKRWPAERYAELSLRFSDLGYATVVNVGPGEEFLAGPVCAANSRAYAMSGTLDQLIACTRKAALAVGGDTGPLHLACALRIPVVGIYGPTDPARNGPHGTLARVLRHPESQRDHSRKSAPETGLLTITVQDVLSEAEDLITGKPSNPVSVLERP